MASIDRSVVIPMGSGIWRIIDWLNNDAYLVTGTSRAALIDTGAGALDLSDVVRELTSLPVIACLTHGHVDHIGGTGAFDVVYLAEGDRALFDRHACSSVRRSFIEQKAHTRHPELSEAELAEIVSAMLEHDVNREPLPYPSVIELGGRVLDIIPTPGHTAGSVCLYDSETESLFSGDTVCDWGVLLGFSESRSLHTYKRSLERISAYAITHIYCGHHSGAIDKAYLELYRELVNAVICGDVPVAADDDGTPYAVGDPGALISGTPSAVSPVRLVLPRREKVAGGGVLLV